MFASSLEPIELTYSRIGVCRTKKSKESSNGRSVSGIYTGYANISYIHNSVTMYGGAANYAVYCNGANQGYGMYYYNNSFVAYDNGYPMYITSTVSIGKEIVLDYNNVYGHKQIGYVGAVCPDFAAWVKASQDQDAANVNPQFYNYKTSAKCAQYNGMNCPVNRVTVDIVDSLRSGSTAMGCYNPIPAAFDVLMLRFEDWSNSVVIGQSTPVKVRVMNNSASTSLTSLRIDWTANGVAQTGYNWSGSLASYQDTVIAIGSFLPKGENNTIVAWISAPNNKTSDDNSENDTLRATAYGCTGPMKGTYTVGKGKNFETVSDAMNILSICGVGGPVTFLVDSGEYEGFSLVATPGMSGVNTVTVTSATGKAEDVVFTGGSPVITFANASHYRLTHVTVDAFAGLYGIYLDGSNNDIQIKHCNINLDPTITTTQYGIYAASGYIRDSIWIVGNRIDGGYYGIYYYCGTGSAANQHGRFGRIDSNVLTNQHYMGAYAYYSDMLSLSYNTVSARPSNGYTYFYGLESYYGNINQVVNNHVDAMRSYLQYAYGIYVYYSNYTYSNSTTDTTLYANNEIRAKAATVYGLYCPYGRAKVVHNSIYAECIGSSGYGIYGYNSSTGFRTDFINNNVVLIGGTSAYPIYAYTTPTYSTFSGNNYYHQGGTYLLYNAGARTTLAAVTTYDATATNVLPDFIDVNIGLYIRKSPNSTVACPMSAYAPADINGEARATQTIRGCYNPTELVHNAALTSFYTPTASICTPGDTISMGAVLFNRGDSIITDVTINWTANNVNYVTYWKGNLATDKEVKVYLGNFTAKANSNNFSATVVLNGHTDELAADNTISGSIYGCTKGALTGTYTVGGSSGRTDFPNLKDAIDGLLNCGVAGPVTMMLNAGTYDAIELNVAIPGASVTNVVTFTSATGDKNDVIIKGVPGTDAVILDNTENIHFTHLTIGDTVYTQNGVLLRSVLKNIHFYDCNIYSQIGATGTAYNAVKRDASSTMLIEDLSFVKCNIVGGYYNVYMINAGTSSSVYGHMTIDSCNLLGAYFSGYFGTYPVYNILTARHNYVHNAANSSSYYGFRFGNMTSYQSIDSLKGNRIWCNASGTNYGVYVGQTVNYNGIGQQLARIWNNEIIVENGSTNYGFYYGNMSYMDWRHNTFYVRGNSNNYGIYNTNTGTYTFNCYDNLFYVSGQGNSSCHQHSGGASNLAAAWMSMDYNVYYNDVNGSIGNGITDVKTWSATIGKDYNALYERVYFKDEANYNFHTNGARGIIPVDPTVEIDREGKPRLSYTNAGCYNDFVPSNYDASLYVITAPTNGETTGQSADCKVKIRNMGKAALEEVTIQWKVNGTLQTPYLWKAQSASDTITYGGISPEIKIGSFIVPAGKYMVEAWTEKPNGFADLNNTNDTAAVEVISCGSPLAGTYVVGGMNSHFATLEDAVTSLLSCGIKAPVVIKLTTGDYDAFSMMETIPGASDVNTVTFTSVAGSADAVSIGNAASPAVKLANIGHVVFDHVTIGGTTTKNSIAVELAGFVEDVLFHHCNLYVNPSSSNSADRVVAYVSSTSATNYLKDVRFIGNEVRGGYYGFYLYYAGGNAANCREDAANRASVRIDSNHIYDQYYYPVYSYYYTYIPSFSHNLIESRSGSNYNYGAYFYYYNLIDSIVGNKIHLSVNYAYSGMRLYYYINNTTFGTVNPVLVANNEIICNGTTYAYGIYTYYANANIINNSIYCRANTNYGLYVGTSGTAYDFNVLNNIIMTENGATANYMVYVTAAATLTTYPTMFNYNDYYTTGTNLNNFYVGGAKNFATWRSTYGMDGKSVQVNPRFANLPEDLSIVSFSDTLKCNRSRAVMRDINNDERTSLTIMGAYSTRLFEGYNLEAELFIEPEVGGVQCYPNSTPVKLRVYNQGTEYADFSKKNLKIYLRCESDSVNLTTNVTVNTGGIGVMSRETYEIMNNLDVTYAGLYKLTAWLEWDMDEQESDDTLLLDYYVSKTILPYENDFSGVYAGVATNQMYGDISWKVDVPSVTPVFGSSSLVFPSSEAKGSISQALFSSVSLQGTYRPQMYFTYLHDNANPYMRDQMEVRISQDGGATFKTIQTLYRYDASCTAPTWRQYQIDLSNYSTGSCIIIALTAYSYGGGDQAVDQVRIIAQQDMRVLVETPSDSLFSACDLTGKSLQVVMENLTTQIVPFSDEDSLTVEISGAGNYVAKYPLASRTRLESLELDTVYVPVDYIGGGQFDIKVWINSIDSNRANDTAFTSVTLNPDVAIASVLDLGYKSSGDTVYGGMTLVNNGNLRVTSPFEVLLVLNSTDTLREKVSSVLEPGDTLEYTFSQWFIVPQTSSDQPYYFVEYEQLLSCDADATNNTSSSLGYVNVMDLGLLSVTSPDANACQQGGSEASVSVRMYNNGNIDAADSVTLVAEIDSAGVLYRTLTEKVSPLTAGENRNVTFTEKYLVPRLSVNNAKATYDVRVYLVSMEGDLETSNDTVSAEGCVEGGVGVNDAVADTWSLGQNQPNPARNVTVIPFSVPEQSTVTLNVMSASGQLLYSTQVEAESGSNSYELNVGDLSAGIYYYTMEYKGQRMVRKMNVVR